MRKTFMPVGLVTYAVQILEIGENVRARMSESGQKDLNGRWVFATLFYNIKVERLFYNLKYNHSRRYPSVECQDCPLAIDLSTLFFETDLTFSIFLEGFKFYLLLLTHRLIALVSLIARLLWLNYEIKVSDKAERLCRVSRNRFYFRVVIVISSIRLSGRYSLCRTSSSLTFFFDFWHRNMRIDTSNRDLAHLASRARQPWV